MRIGKNVLYMLLLAWCMAACQAGESREQSSGLPSHKPKVTVQTDAFKQYWYAGEAEISRYDLEQIRYGEVREGHATLIFVTEDFLTKPQVKLESAPKGRPHETVLKLNHLEEFVTGIYEYKVMTSVFTPVEVQAHPRSLKVAHSTQEWCGVTYAQLNLRGDSYKVTGHSYFEGEADYETSVDATWLEDELWTKLRLSPDLLPEGTIRIIPASFVARTSHNGWAMQQATATRQPWNGAEMPGKNLMSYQLQYESTGRSLTIVYERTAPYRIAGWVQTQQTSSGDTLRATSVRTHRIKAPYWRLNANSDEPMREKLGFGVK